MQNVWETRARFREGGGINFPDSFTGKKGSEEKRGEALFLKKTKRIAIFSHSKKGSHEFFCVAMIRIPRNSTLQTICMMFPIHTFFIRIKFIRNDKA